MRLLLLSCWFGVLCSTVAVSKINPTVQLIRSAGFPVEEHRTVTQDGYYIVLHRIPPLFTPHLPGRVVIYFHGLFGSSVDLVIRGREKGFAYQLSEAGFDVWLPNLRGTTGSPLTVNDTNHNPWDFSWDENALFDFPAIMDYVLATTKAQKVKAVGLSMGANVVLGGLSLRPQYNHILGGMVFLAPTARVKFTSSIVKKAAPHWYRLQLQNTPSLRIPVQVCCTASRAHTVLADHGLGGDKVQSRAGRSPDPSEADPLKRDQVIRQLARAKTIKEQDNSQETLKYEGDIIQKRKLVETSQIYWLPFVNENLLRRFMSWLCSLPHVGVYICASFMFSTESIVFAIEKELVPKLFQHYPHPGSTKTVIHFLQMMDSGRFCAFDYGREGNLRRYNQLSPPDYDLSRVTAPVAIFYSKWDTMVNYKDAEWLAAQLQNTVLAYSVPKYKFAHLSFMWDPNLKNLVYNKVVSVLLSL